MYHAECQCPARIPRHFPFLGFRRGLRGLRDAACQVQALCRNEVFSGLGGQGRPDAGSIWGVGSGRRQTLREVAAIREGGVLAPRTELMQSLSDLRKSCRHDLCQLKDASRLDSTEMRFFCFQCHE